MAVFRCIECGTAYDIEPQNMLCSVCSSKRNTDEPLRGVLEVIDEDPVPENWDVYDFLPVEKRFFPDIPVGNTPLWHPENMRKQTGFSNLYLKDDGLNPSGSLKDRASFLVAAWARKFGIRDIVVASTGNAGSSMSAVGAAAGLNVRLYLPEAAPQAKLVQALQYGADLVKVKGTYDEAYRQSMDYVSQNGGLSRNTGYNPMTIEGKKTVSLEIFKQLGGKPPDYLFVSAGDGVILSGVYKGFEDLYRKKLTTRIPTIIAVQAEGSSAIYRAFHSGSFGPPQAASTIADSISVDVPNGGYYALQRLKKYSGRVVLVSDEKILKAQKYLAQTTGLFTEPAGAAAAAGFIELQDSLDKTATVVILLTGNGLKDVASALKGVQI